MCVRAWAGRRFAPRRRLSSCHGARRRGREGATASDGARQPLRRRRRRCRHLSSTQRERAAGRSPSAAGRRPPAPRRPARRGGRREAAVLCRAARERSEHRTAPPVLARQTSGSATVTPPPSTSCAGSGRPPPSRLLLLLFTVSVLARPSDARVSELRQQLASGRPPPPCATIGALGARGRRARARVWGPSGRVQRVGRMALSPLEDLVLENCRLDFSALRISLRADLYIHVLIRHVLLSRRAAQSRHRRIGGDDGGGVGRVRRGVQRLPRGNAGGEYWGVPKTHRTATRRAVLLCLRGFGSSTLTSLALAASALPSSALEAAQPMPARRARDEREGKNTTRSRLGGTDGLYEAGQRVARGAPGRGWLALGNAKAWPSSSEVCPDV